jgi:hypothetical protein
MALSVKMSVDLTKLLTESVVDAHGPCHPLLSLNGGEYLGRVLESDRSFSQGIADGEEVDESWSQKVISEIQGCKHPWKTYKTTGPIRSPRVPSVFRRERPPANRKMHMRGNVFIEANISSVLERESKDRRDSQSKSRFFGP